MDETCECGREFWEHDSDTTITQAHVSILHQMVKNVSPALEVIQESCGATSLPIGPVISGTTEHNSLIQFSSLIKELSSVTISLTSHSMNLDEEERCSF